MKVVFVRHTPLGKSGAASTEYFPAMLAGQGHSVVMVARAGGDSSFLIKAGVRVIEVTQKESWFGTLRDVINLERPDIVHVFIHAGCGLYPFLIKPGFKSKFVLDIRSPLLRTGMLRYLVRFKNRLETLKYDAIVAHSIESAWTVIGKRAQIHWLPPGVDLDAIPITNHDKPVQPPVQLVYIGSLNSLRQVPTMVEAVLTAAKTLPLKLDIYGDGEDREKIETMLQRSSEGSGVRLMGLVSRCELFRRLTNYDFGLSYIPMGIYNPAPPLKTLEYLASGLPVIATRTTGNAVFVRNGENGLLVDDDPNSFAQGILHLAFDSALGQKLAHNARSSVAEYDWRRIVKKRLLPVYRQLLEDAG